MRRYAGFVQRIKAPRRPELVRAAGVTYMKPVRRQQIRVEHPGKNPARHEY